MGISASAGNFMPSSDSMDISAFQTPSMQRLPDGKPKDTAQPSTLQRQDQSDSDNDCSIVTPKIVFVDLVADDEDIPNEEQPVGAATDKEQDRETKDISEAVQESRALEIVNSSFDLMNAPLYEEVDGELQLMTNETEAPIIESVNIPSDQPDDIQEDIQEVDIQEVDIEEIAIQEVETLQAEFAATTIEQVGDDATEADPLVEATLETVANFVSNATGEQMEQLLAKLGSTLGTSLAHEPTTNRLVSPGREPLPARLTSPDHPTSPGREASPARLVSAGQVASPAKTSKNTETAKSAKRSKSTKTPLVEGELSEHSWTKARKRAQEGLRAMKVGKGPAKGGSPQVPLEEIWKQVDEAHTLPENYPTTSRRGDKPSLGNFDCRFCDYSLTTPTGHRQHEESHFFRYQCDDENCDYKVPEYDGVPALYNNKNSLGLHLGHCDGSVAGAILWKYSLPTKHTRQNQDN